MLECDVVSRVTIPALRMAVSKELSGEHKYKQEKIAEILGVNQATISNYLNSIGSKAIKRAEKVIIERGLERKVVKMIVYGASKKDVDKTLEEMGTDPALIESASSALGNPAIIERKYT